MAHACNPTCSAGRDQEDQFKANPGQIVRPGSSLKKMHHKQGLVEWLKVKTLSSNPSIEGKKKKKIPNNKNS
jgi:hypothetical protein